MHGSADTAVVTLRLFLTLPVGSSLMRTDSTLACPNVSVKLSSAFVWMELKLFEGDVLLVVGRVEQGQAEREQMPKQCLRSFGRDPEAVRANVIRGIRVAFVVKGMLRPKKLFIDYTSAGRSFFRGTRESFTAGLAN
ncbi:hypothetical protein PO909_029044 [Leuciscus waleckii]